MANANLVLIGYAVYLPIAILLTYYVAKTLFKSGEHFMIDIFRGNKDIAVATNRLFKVGFYLLNIGFALFILKMYSIPNLERLVEQLSEKIGGFAIYLGAVLFLHLFLFLKGRKQVRKTQDVAIAG